MNQTLVIGSTVVDMIVEIPHLPVTGEDIHITGQSRSLGGCAFLVSDILRHFKAPNSLCSAVGGGIYGDYVRKHLNERDVPIYVDRPEEHHGCCYCMVEADGERTFIVDHSGIEYTFQEDYLKNIDADSIDSVYVCGLELEEVNGPDILTFLEKHPEYTIYFAPGARIMKIQPDRMERMLSLRPVLHMNRDESLQFTGEPTVEAAARKLYEKTQNAVIITLGGDGAYCLEPVAQSQPEKAEETQCRSRCGIDNVQDIYTPPVPAKTIRDTIGAGDSHIGAVIAGRRLGLSFGEAVRAANYVSSAVVQNRGGLLSAEDFAAAVEAMPEELKCRFRSGTGE